MDTPSVRPSSLSPPRDSSSGAISQISEITQGRRRKQNNVRSQGEDYEHATTIDMLPDNVLLGIFDFYRKDPDNTLHIVWQWNLLVQVCRRWREIIFASPHRLNLQILYTCRTPLRKNLDIWPAFPIVLYDSSPFCMNRLNYERYAALIQEEKDVVSLDSELLGRVCFVSLYASISHLRKIATAMQEPLPMLTQLVIESNDSDGWLGLGIDHDFPAKFLGGSAPCLRKITLSGIPYPTLPTLLLSTKDLVTLRLCKIPQTGYISPEAMVACLAVLPRLDTFFIELDGQVCCRDRIHPPPVTRTVLPALTYFEFGGICGYLGDLLARIDSPQLDQIHIKSAHYPTQLFEFIDRSIGPKLTPYGRARARFCNDGMSFDTCGPADLSCRARHPATAVISFYQVLWWASHITQVLSCFPATLFNAAHLEIETKCKVDRLKGTADVEWLNLLRRFSAVKTLHVSRFSKHVALLLDEITGVMVTEVLPSLEFIHLAGQPASSVENFVAVRQLSGRPVTVVDTVTEFDERLKSYLSEQENAQYRLV